MNGLCVIDACIACDIVRQAPTAPAYESLLETASNVVAPSLYCAECANVIGRYVRSGNCTKKLAMEQYQAALELIYGYVSCESLAQQAMSLSLMYGHKAYDMFYLALAQKTGAALLTSDTRLITIAKNIGVATVTC